MWIANVTKSPMDGKESLVLSVRAPKTAREPRLAIQCEGGKTHLVFDARTVLDRTAAENDRITIRIKYDDAPPRRVLGQRSTDYQAVFLDAPSSHVRTLLKSKRMFVEFTPFLKTESVAEFDVAGLRDYSELLKKHCRL